MLSRRNTIAQTLNEIQYENIVKKNRGWNSLTDADIFALIDSESQTYIEQDLKVLCQLIETHGEAKELRD